MTPKIRIKGFSGEWEEHTMKEHIHFIAGYPFNSSFFNKEGIGLRIIRNRDLHADDQITYTNESCPVKYYVKRNDLLVGMDGDFMPIRWRNEPSVLNQRVGKLICDDDWYLDFFEYALKQPLLDMQNDTGATTVKHLTNTGVENIVRKIPFSKLEQKAIASYFTTLDDMIAGAEKQIASLSQTKAACLQSMFPQEGETTPRVRFKGFEGEWTQKILNECFDIITDRNTENMYGKNDVLSVSDECGVMNQIKLLGRSYAGKSVSGYGILSKGDLVYTKSPLKSKPFGIIKQNQGETGIVSVLYAIYRAKEGTDTEYFHYYFDPAWRLNNYVRPLVNKGAKNTMNISDETALEGKVLVPTLQEQQKIAAYFRSLDQQINLQKKRLEKLRQIKAACLDNMFV